jgi:hypothetical protein
VFVDQPCARSVKRRNAGACLLQHIDRTGQFVRLPYIVLVAKVIVFAGEIFRAGLEQEIDRRPALRTVDDSNLAGLAGFLEREQDGSGAIRRAVVRCYPDCPKIPPLVDTIGSSHRNTV